MRLCLLDLNSFCSLCSAGGEREEDVCDAGHPDRGARLWGAEEAADAVLQGPQEGTARLLAVRPGILGLRRRQSAQGGRCQGGGCCSESIIQLTSGLCRCCCCCCCAERLRLGCCSCGCNCWNVSALQEKERYYWHRPLWCGSVLCGQSNRGWRWTHWWRWRGEGDDERGWKEAIKMMILKPINYF